jgi:hypothetical protein
MISGELSRSNRITFISQGTSRVAAEYPGEVRNQFLAWINQANESATKRGRNRTT